MMYQLAPDISLETTGPGDFLVASRPLRMVRLNPSLLRLVQRMQFGAVDAATEAEKKVLETLVKKGFAIRRCQGLEELGTLPRVSIIIPVKDRAEDLRLCLASLKQLEYPQSHIEVLVVDDGSSDATPQVALESGATLLESGQIGGGPALARNRGAAAASGEILAFIDSDCTAAPNWLNELLPAFADVQLAAVGGWVDGMYQGSALDRYEAVMSSLNLGRRELSGGSGGDTFYLPSCNLLLRKKAFDEAGGFRSELQVGEDVDLTWRLRDAGWKLLYQPSGTVYHAHRSRLWPFMKRRFEYGTSEGLLQRLHPVRGKKMLLPPLLTSMLVLSAIALVVGSLWPLPLAAGLLLFSSGRTMRAVHRQGLALPLPRILTAQLRATGSLGYYLGYHLLRYYLLPLLGSLLLFPQLLPLLLVAVTGVALVDYSVRKPKLQLPGFIFYYLLEQLSYGSGVFWGCLKLKNFSSYRLQLRPDPTVMP